MADGYGEKRVAWKRRGRGKTNRKKRDGLVEERVVGSHWS